jgi:small conductance mechanosensitive channel
VVWFIVILIILAELNVDITPIIASAGVLGLAVGFGSQEMVKDFIAGFFIIFESIFNVGDVIEVQGFKGNVTSIGLRSTVITNWKGEVKTVSNGDISSCINFSKNDSLAIVDFGVAYDTDLNNLKTVVEAELENFKSKYEDMIELPQFLGVTELASSSINLRLIAKTKKMKHFAIERGLRKDLVELCEKNNIEIPFPQVVIHNAKN